MRRPDINSRPEKTEADPIIVTSSDIIEEIDKAMDCIENGTLETAMATLIDLRQDLEEENV